MCNPVSMISKGNNVCLRCTLPFCLHAVLHAVLLCGQWSIDFAVTKFQMPRCPLCFWLAMRSWVSYL